MSNIKEAGDEKFTRWYKLFIPSIKDLEGINLMELEVKPKYPYESNMPRHGRFECPPQSQGIRYVFNVLKTNFLNWASTCGLHHCFVGRKGIFKGKLVETILDISFFEKLDLPEVMLNFNSYKYGGRIPNFVLNVLSYSTWRVDLVENVDVLKCLGVHVYAVYKALKTISCMLYYRPLLRVYLLEEMVLINK